MERMRTLFIAIFACCALAAPACAQTFAVTGDTRQSVGRLQDPQRAARLAAIAKKVSAQESCDPVRSQPFGPGGTTAAMWVLRCKSGRDLMISLPETADKAVISMSCFLAKNIGNQDCNAAR
jgi:hypothetical protein